MATLQHDEYFCTPTVFCNLHCSGCYFVIFLVQAVGCLFYEMCALKPPFDAQNLISLFFKIIKAEYEVLYNILIPAFKMSKEVKKFF